MAQFLFRINSGREPLFLTFIHHVEDFLLITQKLLYHVRPFFLRGAYSG